MEYKLNKNEALDVQAMAYFSKYFTDRLEDGKKFDPSQLHVYDGNPQRKGAAPKELSGTDLRTHMNLSQPMFVTYGDDKMVPFMANKGKLCSGQELASMANDMKLQEPEEPESVPRPGRFSRFLARIGIKTKSYKTYKAHQRAMESYSKAKTAYEDLQTANRISANLDETRTSLQNKAEATLSEDGTLQIGEAQNQGPKLDPEVKAAYEAEQAAKKAGKGQKEHKKHSVDHENPAQYKIDRMEAKAMGELSTAQYNKEQQELHTITADQFASLPESDKGNWTKLGGEKYEDAVWRNIENEKTKLRRQVDQTKKPAPLDLDACTGLTEEQRDAHTAELNKLHRAADCKTVADTLVNEILGDEKSFQKMSKFVTVSRETLERPIRYGRGIENLLNESPDAPRLYAKMAKEHPDQLVKKYQEHVAAAKMQQEQPAKSAQPVKNMQPAQPQMQAPANH